MAWAEDPAEEGTPLPRLPTGVGGEKVAEMRAECLARAAV